MGGGSRVASSSWHTEETFKALTTLAIEGLRFIALINGGAAVAVVAYGLGKLPSVSLKGPMACFLVGVVLAAVAHVLAYLTQLALYGEEAEPEHALKGHIWFLWSTVLASSLAIVAFVAGCWCVVSILSH